MQIISPRGEIHPGTLILSGAFNGSDTNLQPEDGYLYIMGESVRHTAFFFLRRVPHSGAIGSVGALHKLTNIE